MEVLKAFLIGGAICAICQIIIDKTKITPGRVLTALVVLGCILGAVGIYEPFAEWAGAGATVPLPGFGYLLAKGAIKAVDERGFAGVLTGGLTATAGGITAAMVFGLLGAGLFRSKEK